ncbi:hypothetical protein SDRG_14845 [Saprolegnia diclina VS20]|uniref:Pre-mRNA-splicing factor 18 n=1 Tax=Saprolegnia diclina (strain VS20) TaxID=1156394 RepID=T0Q1Q3_SAPDV|nr:hypothetical protein SDRG_14845 [Saprolegnia diclina VS20]EQC27320.1 hypothetical protein SDRG_14845 [Saprolegnia diclina VS20]|eukprot:XP_008619224.1 hypothetical protein SDRG_14845 [Saprolegnia diclina VS20]
MDQMKAMMAKLKRQREEEKMTALKVSGEPAAKKKYMRRGEIEAALEEEERRAREAVEAEAAKKREAEEHTAAQAAAQASTNETKAAPMQERATETSADDGQLHFTLAETKKRLRQLGHPITLFGETDEARARRLEALIHSNEGGEMDLNQAGYIDAQEADEDKEDDEYDHDGDANKDHESESDERKIYRFFKEMLGRWEEALAARPESVKRSAQGKIATRTMKQCKDYIRPLFRLCKSNTVPDDILKNLVDIVGFCKAGEFVSANDSYIKLAIGNAAWPIGVTMVGIHERTGREKINSNKQAHVMNNELQRKYLTSVKRLITFAQSITDVLPSKKVC